ncbi:hypothetical protein GCM10023145_16860 [Angustibacter luteus]
MGPASRFTNPTTIGLLVALFGVAKGSAPAAADPDGVADDDDEGLELLHAVSSATAATATPYVTRTFRFIAVPFGGAMCD